MREGSFVGLTAESRPGTELPVLRLEAFPLMERSFAQKVIEIPGADRVPEDAARQEARRVAERGAKIRQEAQARGRSRIGKEFERFAKKTRLPVAVAAMSLFAHAPTTERTEHTTRKRDVPSFMDTLPSEAQMKEELSWVFGAERLEQELPTKNNAFITSKDVATITTEPRKDRDREKQEADEQEIRNFARAFLPGPWVAARTVNRFAVAEAPIPMDPSYGLHGYADGVCRGGVAEDPSQIVFAPGHHADDPGFSGLIAHEAAHANDWKRSNDLSERERTTLLYAVHARATSEDRARFPYVESIHNEDPHEEALFITTEYWAELMSLALTTDATTREEWRFTLEAELMIKQDKATAQDVSLVEWYLRTATPGFKPWDSVKRRQAFQTRRVEGLVDRVIQEKFPPGKLKMLLMRPFGSDERTTSGSPESRPRTASMEAASDIFFDLLRARIALFAPSEDDDVSKAAETFIHKAEELGMALRGMNAEERRMLEDEVEEAAFSNGYLKD